MNWYTPAERIPDRDDEIIAVWDDGQVTYHNRCPSLNMDKLVLWSFLPTAEEAKKEESDSCKKDIIKDLKEKIEKLCDRAFSNKVHVKSQISINTFYNMLMETLDEYTNTKKIVKGAPKDGKGSLTGWFFSYRGNYYGPYNCWDDALKKFREKHNCSPNSVVHPVYGTAEIKDQKLIKFNF